VGLAGGELRTRQPGGNGEGGGGIGMWKEGGAGRRKSLGSGFGSTVRQQAGHSIREWVHPKGL
jgi:hypothetical protein